ncbi:hypothetical protein K9N68_35535 (plasmid) [Kovacikia minuta CCNUW1]|uniref:hypothetical protein n=1 Tax=Kovacikia minuta TaxID=2931930 RepID=UPI001CCE13C7|nr:hypothetical protein [Kovacikia minuta]UBF30496.1 hypothetical protein K9N68_35535 [Kovacikia minuta CCNUW1]
MKAHVEAPHPTSQISTIRRTSKQVAKMAASQSLRSLLSDSMIGRLCAQRLGMELLITVSVLLTPLGLQGKAIDRMYSPDFHQLCSMQDKAIAMIEEFHFANPV